MMSDAAAAADEAGGGDTWFDFSKEEARISHRTEIRFSTPSSTSSI